MLKKLLKVLGAFFLTWFVYMMTIEHNFRYKYTFLTQSQVKGDDFEFIKVNFSTESPFQVWRSLQPASQNLTFEDKIAIIRDSIYPPGENGTAVLLEDDIKHYIRINVHKGWRDHAFNQFVSDIISLNRTLPDVRDKWCKRQNYSDTLPTVSIIICFHNEAWTTLIRTVHSVINRSPLKIINEIILFDDYSNMQHLKSNLEEYVRRLPKTILVKSSRREGLIRARMKAMRYATGSVIVFLDSHCECNKGWLEPLIDRIVKNPTTIASPAVDLIHDKTFEYIAQDTNNLRIGGFTWDLKFIWMGIPQKTLFRRPHPSAPIKTPTISGGLFAVQKDFFQKIGFYDEKLDIWGGDNLELSFKTWMCGGSLEIVPCSHVGHIFRKRMPYKGYKGDTSALQRNLLRVAEVWMDDYKQYFLERIGNPRIYLKDVSSRKQLREDLKCKSFKWYLKNVYPQLEIPDKYAASGQIYNVDLNLCLDLMLESTDSNATVQLYTCHNNGGNQFWVYTRHGQIKRDEYCLEYVENVLQMFFCSDHVRYQKWLFNNMTQLIKHVQTRKCLQITKYATSYKLTVNKCAIPATPMQKWTMDNFIFERLDRDLYTH